MFFSKKKKEDEPIKKGNWLVITHNWFVDSEGFKHYQFSDMTRAQVEKEAKAICHDNYDTFSKCAYHIIKVE